MKLKRCEPKMYLRHGFRMITVETEGVEAILHFLEKIERSDIKQEDLETLMEKNAYFVDFYASWQKVTRNTILSSPLSTSGKAGSWIPL